MIVKKTPGMEYHFFFDEYIKRSGLPVSTVARHCHIPASSLRNYCNGKVIPPLQYIIVLADYFEVPLCYMFQYKHLSHICESINNIEFQLLE